MVTDIVMPGGMNGVDLCKGQRFLRPDLKIVYLFRVSGGGAWLRERHAAGLTSHAAQALSARDLSAANSSRHGGNDATPATM